MFSRALHRYIAGLLLLLSTAAYAQDSVRPGSERWNFLFQPDYTTPTELPRDSPLKPKLMNMLYEHFDPLTNVRPYHFAGKISAFKNWAFFLGSVRDEQDRPVRLPPADTATAAGLWLRTRQGWRLVDHAAGFPQAFYWTWHDQYGAPRALLGLP